VRRQPAPFEIFSAAQPEAAEEEVAEVLADRTGYLGAGSNVAILPLLASDPDPGDGEAAWTEHRFEPRSQARVIAPRRRSSRAPLRIVSAERQPEPLRTVLLDAGVEVPAEWDAGYSRQLGGRRRWTEIDLPVDADPAQIVAFSCRAIAMLDADRPPGLWIVAASRHSRLPPSVTG